jgi:hypothetical protein
MATFARSNQNAITAPIASTPMPRFKNAAPENAPQSRGDRVANSRQLILMPVD